MAMMAKMRSLAPAFIITVGVLFVLFMVISDSSVLEALGGRTNDVGSVNGETISYQEFSKILDQQRENQKAQTGKDVDEDNMTQFRNQVWDAVVTQKLLEQQIEKYGITVSDQEIKDIILSDNPPDFLKKSFIDSTGQFNAALYKQALMDTRNSQALIQAEEVVRQNSMNEKLQSMLLASITVNDAEIKRNFIDENTDIKVKYAEATFAMFPDSMFTVTDEEMQNYYNENLDKFKVDAQRKLKYVFFPTTASALDSQGVKNNLESVADHFKRDTASFKSYINIYSSEPYSQDTLDLNQFPAGARDMIANSSPGQLVGPAPGPKGYVLYRVIAKLRSSKTFYKVSHILINKESDDAKNKEEANKIYDELKQGADFAKLAKEKSADPSSAVKGGDIGWIGKGETVPEFEKAVFNGPMGVVQRPVKSGFGYHIIKVTGKNNYKYVVEKIVTPVNASATTKDDRKNAASDFAYLAQKNDFSKEAEIAHYTIKETTPFKKDAFFIPGIGVNKRIIDFAFDNDLNTISDVFSVQNGYVIVMVSDVINPKVKTFDEVKAQIRPDLLKEKKEQKAKALAENIKARVGNDIDKVSSLFPNVKFDTTGSFKPGGVVPGIGKDYAFIETSLNEGINKVSAPVKGISGYYLIDVTYRSPFDSTKFSIQKNSIRDKILQQKKGTFFNEWLAKLKKDADIVDNRYIFYGQ